MIMSNTFPRPRNKPTRFWIDNEYIGNGYMAQFHASVTKVYAVLARHANAKTRTCYPSLATIAKETGLVNRGTIIAAIKLLERFGMIGVIRSPHKANKYILRDCRTWALLGTGWCDKDTTQAQTGRLPKNTDTVSSDDRSGIVAGTPIQKSESEKEIMGNSPQKEETKIFEGEIWATISPMNRHLLKTSFDPAQTEQALKKLSEGGTVIKTLTAKELVGYLRNSGVTEIKPIGWL